MTEPDKYEAFQALTVLSPDDVPTPTPVLWQAERYSDAGQRLLNLHLPADWPYPVERGTADDTLTQLALGTAMRRQLLSAQGSTIHQALRLGATWTQVAAALDVDTAQARQLLRQYIDGQLSLFQHDGRFGMSPAGHAEAAALTELDDDRPAGADAAAGAR
ncbi:hypothetical protein ACWEPB_37015 [Kitasatospora cineracea]